MIIMAAKESTWRAFKEEMKRKRTKGSAKDTKRLKKSEFDCSKTEFRGIRKSSEVL